MCACIIRLRKDIEAKRVSCKAIAIFRTLYTDIIWIEIITIINIDLESVSNLYS